MKVLEAVQPVKITNLTSFISRGSNSHYVIKRIKDRDHKLDAMAISKMKQYGNSLLGKDYDLYFGWSSERIYCTELVWKIYKNALDLEVGELKSLSDFDLSSPQVKRLMNKRYGSQIPFKEPVISPSDMFESKHLTEVLRVN